MQIPGLVNYVLAIIVAFLGLGAGYVVSNLAKEELKPGKIYFALFQRIILVVFSILFFSYIGPLIYITNKIALFLFLSAIALLLIKFRISPYIAYPVFGLALYLAQPTNLFITLASLVFLYGIAVYALKPDLNDIPRYSWYFVTSLFPVVLSLVF